MSNNKKRPIDISTEDPLSRITRNERRVLLIVSAIGIIMVKTGLTPSKISAFGIEFNSIDQASILFTVAALNFYFLIAFFIYAISDYHAWRMKFYAANKEMIGHQTVQDTKNLLRKELDINKRAEQELRKRYPFRKLLLDISNLIWETRAFFEFLIPILIAIYAIYVLVIGAINLRHEHKYTYKHILPFNSSQHMDFKW